MKELNHIMRFTSFTGKEEMNPSLEAGLKNQIQQEINPSNVDTTGEAQAPEATVSNTGRIKGISDFQEDQQ